MRRLALLLLFAIPCLGQTNGTITGQGGIVAAQLPAGTTQVTARIYGTFVGASIILEQSSDGQNFTPVGSMTTPGTINYSVVVASGAPSITVFQARAASYLSGIINVQLTPSSVPIPASSGATNIAITNLPVATLPAIQPVNGTVNVGNFPATQPVSFSGGVSVNNFPVTQPVSLASSPLPSGASTAAKQPSIGVAGTPSPDVISVQGVSGGVAQPVSGTIAVSNFPGTQAVTGAFFQATQPVSLASAPTTPASQSGTWTVQPGNTANTTAWKVDGSAVTQPVSLASVPTHAVTQSGIWTVGISGTVPVSLATAPTTPVTGAFFQTTQPVSMTALPPLVPSTASTSAISASAKATLTTSTNVKASTGNVYGIFALNGAASTCWVELINSASAGTLGTAVIFSIPLPASTTQPVWITLPYPVNFSTGIAIGIATTNGGATACGTAGNVTVFFL